MPTTVNYQSLLGYAAAAFSILIGAAVLLRTRRKAASWFFGGGMCLLAADSVLGGLSLQASSADEIATWQTLALTVKALMPSVWLGFSLTYSRGNYREFLARFRPLLILALLVPLSVVVWGRNNLLNVQPFNDVVGAWWIRYEEPAKFLNGLLLIASVAILMNVEKTFRSAVGTMQWRIKFVVIGVGIIFGARIYTRSQGILFSGHNLALIVIDLGALIIGCVLIFLAYVRAGFRE
ncbi:MAG: hypothetical protein H0U99_00960, partial [Chthoniobacterales bacterium]|nr:hypothetical protein [Chthoniobacterales bacterium]